MCIKLTHRPSFFELQNSRSFADGQLAVGNAYQEKLNLGYDKTTACAYGVMVGASEAVSGEEANVNWEEALYSSLMGFITGGLFEGVDIAINTAAKVTNRIITKADIGNMEALINPIHEVTGVSAEQLQNPLPSQMDPINPNMTTENVGQQSETDQAMKNQANAAVHQEAVAQSLRSKGISSKKVDGIAEAITARLNGQELTRPQRNILRSALESPTVQSVVSEFMKKKTDGIDSVQKDVYDKENIRSLKNGEETALRVSSNLEALSTEQQRGEISEKADFEDTAVAEDTPIHQERNALPKRRYRGGKATKKTLCNK